MKTSDISPELKKKIVSAVNQRLLKQVNNPLDEALIVEPPQIELRDRRSFEFALGACQYPAGLLDADLAYDSYRRLAIKIAEKSLSPDALILTGDQIYADATAGLFDPVQLDDNFRRSYERFLQKNPVGEVMRQIPVVTMLDDHEIFDNFEPINSDYFPEISAKRNKNYEHAIKHFIKYQRHVGPYPDNTISEVSGEKIWCSLEKAGLPLFLGNSRTEREHRTAANIHEARIMGKAQFTALKEWLIDPALEDLPKLVVTPSILLPRHTRLKSSSMYSEAESLSNALLSDSWDGYPASFHDLLLYIAENQIRNVIFLSGDEHLGCACRASIQSSASSNEVIVHSIHTSALYAPYPFANGIPAKLSLNETFDVLSDTARNTASDYKCEVSSSVYPGSGFTIIKLTRDTGGSWKLNCEFNRASSEVTKHYESSLT